MTNLTLYKKSYDINLNINDYIIGKLTRKCSVGKIISITETDYIVDVYDNYDGSLDDTITLDKKEFFNKYYKADKIKIDDNDDYIILKHEDEELY